MINLLKNTSFAKQLSFSFMGMSLLCFMSIGFLILSSVQNNKISVITDKYKVILTSAKELEVKIFVTSEELRNFIFRNEINKYDMFEMEAVMKVQVSQIDYLFSRLETYYPERLVETNILKNRFKTWYNKVNYFIKKHKRNEEASKIFFYNDLIPFLTQTKFDLLLYEALADKESKNFLIQSQLKRDNHFKVNMFFSGILIILTLISFVLFSNARNESLERIRQNALELERRVKEKTQELSYHKKLLDLTALVSEVDCAGQLTYVNQSFCEKLGFGKDELLGMSLNSLSKSAIEEKLFNTTGIWKGENNLISKNGDDIWLESTISPIYQNNKISGYSFIEIDISDKKTAIIKEKEALEIKSRFLANMSHEIRTPMNGVLGMVSLLSDSDLNDDQKDMVDTVSSCGENLMVILNDILDLSKIESGKLELEISEFNLEKCISETLFLNSHKASLKKINIETNLDTNLPEYFLGDVTRLKQILINLLTNAVKFTSMEGHVSLKVRAIEKKDDVFTLEFIVKDDGIGIAQENHDKVFHSFSQADSSTTREFGGTGLGLAIISSLVGIMGGKVKLDSSVGIGSTFTITLKLQESIQVNIAEVESTEIAQQEVKYHQILLVEDNIINQKLAKLMFEKNGHSCDIAFNGQEALDILAKNPKKYSVIFMDMQMPVMGGIEATQKIIEIYQDKRPPIVAMTANAFKEDRDLCFSAGMEYFLSKPVKPSDIDSILKKVG